MALAMVLSARAWVTAAAPPGPGARPWLAPGPAVGPSRLGGPLGRTVPTLAQVWVDELVVEPVDPPVVEAGRGGVVANTLSSARSPWALRW